MWKAVVILLLASTSVLVQGTVRKNEYAGGGQCHGNKHHSESLSLKCLPVIYG